MPLLLKVVTGLKSRWILSDIFNESSMKKLTQYNSTCNKNREQGQSGVVKCGKSIWARKDYSWENERIALRSHYFESIAGIDVSRFPTPFKPAYPLCRTAVGE